MMTGNFASPPACWSCSILIAIDELNRIELSMRGSTRKYHMAFGIDDEDLED